MVCVCVLYMCLCLLLIFICHCVDRITILKLKSADTVCIHTCVCCYVSIVDIPVSIIVKLTELLLPGAVVCVIVGPLLTFLCQSMCVKLTELPLPGTAECAVCV